MSSIGEEEGRKKVEKRGERRRNTMEGEGMEDKRWGRGNKKKKKTHKG